MKRVPFLGLPSLVNQRFAKIACPVSSVINNEDAPKSMIKDLIEQRNNKHDLCRGNDISKRPMANSSTYRLKSWWFTAPKL